MKLVVQVRLYPDAGQAAALAATLSACNAAASQVAQVLFEQKPRGVFDLQKLVYVDVKTGFGLSAQPTIRVIKKVFDAQKTLKSLVRSGRMGKVGSPRRTRIEGKPVEFRVDAAQPFDDRCLSWQIPDEGQWGTVSIWTVAGRLRGITFRGSAERVARLRDYRKGESDLVFRDGKWFLYATCDIPDVPVNENPVGFIGVDLGIVNIAYTSTEVSWSGGATTFRRKKNQHLRTKLQTKGTTSAKRLLKKRSKKEARFVTDLNHKIAHKIVAEAERPGHGIAIEDLEGIRARVRLRKPRRATLHSWAFHQLGTFLEYKAAKAGVPFVRVDPAYTSQTCSQPGCGHCERANRNREKFVCRRCGTISHADYNASRNIRVLGQIEWDRFVGQKSPVRRAA